MSSYGIVGSVNREAAGPVLRRLVVEHEEGFSNVHRRSVAEPRATESIGASVVSSGELVDGLVANRVLESVELASLRESRGADGEAGRDGNDLTDSNLTNEGDLDISSVETEGEESAAGSNHHITTFDPSPTEGRGTDETTTDVVVESEIAADLDHLINSVSTVVEGIGDHQELILGHRLVDVTHDILRGRLREQRTTGRNSDREEKSVSSHGLANNFRV